VSLYVSGVIWVLGVAAIAGLVAVLVHRFSSDEGRASNDAVGQVFTIVGGLHAVLMAFVLISLFDAVSAARDGSRDEANSVVGVYWAADALPDPARSQIQDLTRSYTRTVIDQEWPSMRNGEAVNSGPGWAQLDRMRALVNGVNPSGDWQMDRKAEATNQLWSLYQARQARMTAAASSGVSTVVWLALIVGSILSISLPYLLDGPKLLTRIIIMSTLAAAIALLMFAIYQLQNPFSGGARVGTDAFDSIIGRISPNKAG
jgi:vacuolar-type H+-ATPase subunit I/STV1